MSLPPWCSNVTDTSLPEHRKLHGVTAGTTMLLMKVADQTGLRLLFEETGIAYIAVVVLFFTALLSDVITNSCCHLSASCHLLSSSRHLSACGALCFDATHCLPGVSAWGGSTSARSSVRHSTDAVREATWSYSCHTHTLVSAAVMSLHVLVDVLQK